MKHILLTGGTGFLGGTTLAHWFTTDQINEMSVLVRASSESEARERIHKSVARFVGDENADKLVLRCHVLHGDITEKTWLDRLDISQITHVLHLAANTSFRSARGVRHTNILGTMTLAHAMRRAANLERFLHVGTAFICGANPEPVVHEDEYPRHGVKHVVEYTSSKAECEMLFENTAPELPLVIARPSVVVGHTTLGCGPSASLFWYFRAMDLLRRTNFPLEFLNDIIPVDYAAKALYFLLLKPELQYRRYHISAGASKSETWTAIARVFAKHYGERPENPYRIIDFDTLVKERDRFQKLLGHGNEDHLLMALKIYFQLSDFEVIFDNERLLAEGMPPPPKFTDYLDCCIALSSDKSIYQQMVDDE